MRYFRVRKYFTLSSGEKIYDDAGFLECRTGLNWRGLEIKVLISLQSGGIWEWKKVNSGSCYNAIGKTKVLRQARKAANQGLVW